LNPNFAAKQGGNTPLPSSLPKERRPDRRPFVRLNAFANPRSSGSSGELAEQYNRFPKDMITIGSIWREQGAKGGVFKHADPQAQHGDTADKKHPRVILPANGTLDDVRFYSGPLGTRVPGAPERYDGGRWTGEIDLADRFTLDNTLQLGQLEFTAYLPARWGTFVRSELSRGGDDKPSANGGGSVTVTVSILDPTGAQKFERSRTFKEIGDDSVIPLVTATGLPIYVQRYPNQSPTARTAYDKIQYKIEMEPFEDGRGVGVATPVLDDLTLTYYLPTPRVLLKENVYD
jgi:hypothetical protein